MSLDIITVERPRDAGPIVADIVVELISSAVRPVLGLATGASMVAVYDELVARYRRGEVSFAHCRAVLLDEYVGLTPADPESCGGFITAHLSSGVDLREDAILALDGSAADPYAECERFEAALVTMGGVDLQLLGIGRNGHLAFNEPGTSLSTRTHVAELAATTRSDNARGFSGAVPARALTQGIATILDARHLVLLAFGEAKRAGLAAALSGPIGPDLPASAVRMHRRVTVVVDRAAHP